MNFTEDKIHAQDMQAFAKDDEDGPLLSLGVNWQNIAVSKLKATLKWSVF